ncbi:hypothetical protein [Ilumatobacter coccineus]|jgi:hypothetical protein|uniref:Uncharacterized protein n=1 Tax=Ilumatobacter coccineus (strain NBRC 103263 / KCTC 29153 / YM16-304) TaxID=1313172 RepID=A0A6C7ECY6_ILUCY|nr:hypothetical protein [Ilumatobacter coccineus]BAN04230.1 hypothetical protein YM304_39160 [Ilumatobacter coccineus YM16-304]
MNIARGDGVGIEVSDAFVRAVRLRHDVAGRVAAAVELPFVSYDDGAALDSLVLLRAELGEPNEPTKIAVFPPTATLQRIDVTGRSGPELNETRATLDRRRGIDSTLVVDDGPRRWLLLIRWDASDIRRLEDLAERAGFVDVTVEPSPLALGRVLPRSTSYARRLVGHADAHHAVFSNGVPVAAAGASIVGRTHPDLDVSDVEIPVVWFEDLLDEAQLNDLLIRSSRSADARASLLEHEERHGSQQVSLGIVGEAYPAFPVHDIRAPERQAVALGAAIGAAGLAGSLRPVDMTFPVGIDAQQFDRPWAIERLVDLPEPPAPPTIGPVKRMTTRFRPRRSRR